MLDLDQIQTSEDSREHIKWKLERERHAFLHKIYPAIGNRESEIWAVGIQAILKKEEIDRYLSAAVELMAQGPIDAAVGKRFVRFVRLSGYRDKSGFGWSKACRRRTTAIHRSRQLGVFDVLDDLFEIYGNFGPKFNYEDEFGWTHFHVACAWKSERVVRKFLDRCDKLANLRVKETGDAPLHLAWDPATIELLLRMDADPNLANAEGLTPLHVICTRDAAYMMLMKFFLICKEMNLSVEVNARDKRGETPLHVALRYGKQNETMRMLNVGADPTLANADGETPLHVICRRESNEDPLAKKFFGFCDRHGRTLDVDARDKFGNTPLHLAAFGGHVKLMEMLLSRDANPHLANEEGLNPLHVICKTNRLSLDYRLVTTFFEGNDKKRQQPIVDVRDKKGRTPLQWAVANIQPQVMEYLFDRGADASTFVFPTEEYFGKRLRPWKSRSSRHFKLGLAAGAMIIVKYLESIEGCELELSQTLTIMKLFAEYELFAKSAENRWYDDEEFKRQAQTIMMKEDVKPGLSLYELISLQPMEAEKRVTLKDYLECAHSSKLEKLPDGSADDCAQHLCEKASRRFFRHSALYPLWELVRYRLPILCCHMIIEELPNEDLASIVEAYSLS